MEQGGPKNFEKLPSSRYRYEDLLSQRVRRLTDHFSCRFREGLSFPKSAWRGPSWNCLSPSSLLCPLFYRIEPFLERAKGEKVPREGEEEEWPAKGAKGKN